MLAHTLFTILRIIKNTHRHPINQALHSIGAPFYTMGLVLMLSYAAGTIHHQQYMVHPLAAGTSIWLAAIAMFVVGHKIEGNMGSMAPVLLFRLVSRKVARYSVAQRFHFLHA